MNSKLLLKEQIVQAKKTSNQELLLRISEITRFQKQFNDQIFFLLIGHFVKINHCIFCHFKLQKKNYFFKSDKIFSDSKTLILSKSINDLSVSLIFQIAKSKSTKSAFHFVLAKSIHHSSNERQSTHSYLSAQVLKFQICFKS